MINQVLTFIWIIGWLFTFGVLFKTMDGSSKDYLRTLLFTMVGWPIFLGVVWSEKQK